MRTTITLDDAVAAEARELGINLSEAARTGIAEAVRHARAMLDRRAYERLPEASDDDWASAQAWTP